MNELVCTGCFFQNEVQVIFKKLEEIPKRNILVFVFRFLSGPVYKSLVILDYLLGRNEYVLTL